MQPRLLTARRGVGIVLGLLGLACTGEPDAGLATDRAAIVNGEPSDEIENYVVNITGQISETFKLNCSGTLIAPDVVLTALHCVSYREDPNATFTCNPDGTIVQSVPNAGELGMPIDGEDVEVHFGTVPDSEPDAYGRMVFGSGAQQICRGDIALVVLDRELVQDVPPIRFDRRVRVGEMMKIVGYGQTEQPSSQGRYRRSALRVLDVGVTECGPGSSTTPPETFVLGQGACHGDSGGPAFSEETGAITGVYSLSLAPSCTSIGVRNTFVVVPSFEGMIRDALEYAGREPVLEPEVGGSAGMTGCAASGGTGGTGGTDTGGSDTGGSDTGGTATGGSGGSDTGGSDTGGGDTGGSGAVDEGSGSRRDPGCACEAPGGRPLTAYGWFGLAFAVFAAARRRNRNGRPVLGSSGTHDERT